MKCTWQRYLFLFLCRPCCDICGGESREKYRVVPAGGRREVERSRRHGTIYDIYIYILYVYNCIYSYMIAAVWSSITTNLNTCYPWHFSLRDLWHIHSVALLLLWPRTLLVIGTWHLTHPKSLFMISYQIHLRMLVCADCCCGANIWGLRIFSLCLGS